MTTYKELSFEQKREISELFACWLRPYTHECAMRAMERADEIINNEATLNLLRELKAREEKELENLIGSMDCLLGDFETFKQYNIHNNPLSHSTSYRDILHDMYL